MSCNKDKVRREALSLLGFADESHLSVASSLIENDELSGAAIADLLPSQLISLTEFLLDDDYRQRIPVDLQELPAEVLEEARNVCLCSFSKLVEHPSYPDTVRLVREKIKATSQSPETDEEDTVCDIHSVSSFPLLIGDSPPYTPALKISVSTKFNKKVFSEILLWHDLLFLARAFMQQVSTHATKSEDVIRSNTVSTLDTSVVDQIVGDLKSSVDSLGKKLLPARETKEEEDK